MEEAKRGGAEHNGWLPLCAEKNVDDRSSPRHRLITGGLGVVMVPLLVILSVLFPDQHTGGWRLDSISCYYYSGGTGMFVGILFILAYYLLTYQGYDNAYQRLDRRVANTAALAALSVALFPCCPTNSYVEPNWWQDWMGSAHNMGAIVLFSSFAFFSFWLFTRGAGQGPASKRRRKIYFTCGTLIVAALLWAGYQLMHERPIFWAEATALWAFSVSWLTKGRAEEPTEAFLRNIRKHPKQYVKHLLR